MVLSNEPTGIHGSNRLSRRERLYQAATPQVFERTLLEKAYQSKSASLQPTDDAQLVESSGHRVRLVARRSNEHQNHDIR